jgi:hypothetical protein
VFPPPKGKAKKQAQNGSAAIPSGTRTWQVAEAEDLWDNIQDAQNAAALKALSELMPDLTSEYQLQSPLRCACRVL